ncbi:MAG: hypothetical protein ICV63_18695 [Coleofasciculus sp. Co-bin14]|nr:hypothetical protein [Coleofasciculus sp. Co-bin14]
MYPNQSDSTFSNSEFSSIIDRTFSQSTAQYCDQGYDKGSDRTYQVWNYN